MEENLDAYVRTLLLACRGDWPEVVSAVGVSHSWISKFVNGHIDNPGYQTLKRLESFLSARTRPAAQRQVSMVQAS